jgi:hypothetical protein
MGTAVKGDFSASLVSNVIKTYALSITATATVLRSADVATVRSFLVRNFSSAVKVYLGGSDVSSLNGFPLEPGATFGVDLSAGVNMYLITAAGETAPVRVWEAY